MKFATGGKLLVDFGLPLIEEEGRTDGMSEESVGMYRG